MSDGALRVVVTLDELAAVLGLPAHHQIERLTLSPDDRRLALVLHLSGPGLPSHRNVLVPSPCCALDGYHDRLNPTPAPPQSIPVDAARAPLTFPAAPAAAAEGERHQQEQDLRLVPRRAKMDDDRGYTPARAPVAASEPAPWPKFPGQDLKYTGGDPSDESEHFGGPR